MSLSKVHITILACLIWAGLSAQSASDDSVHTIRISGQVLDIWDKTPVPGVSVINSKKGQSIATDEKGQFTVICEKGDMFFLFLSGYKTLRFSMADSINKPEYQVSFEYERLTAGLSQPLIIKPKQTLNDIEKQRQKLGQIPKELQQPDIPLTSPISALYELLSNRAHERTKLREQMQEDERRRIYRELFDYYKEAGLFDLPDDRYEQFITYLDLPVDFLKHNTDYMITKTVLDAYKKFGLERGFIK